ncbi:hypothetical protein DPMN_146951 [Dreissena polymorpha]|uniref:Uncharacterized protein n=1 Tax=Dreissena polymorpha TaxID=45954 RepID=A0A9D4FCS0_DREPO|nr:hypothetical protein DPMN_146951 [Dreissena polymorpha]
MQTWPTFTSFVKKGGSAPSNNRSTNAGILNSARDFGHMVDLKKQLKFPLDVATTTLRANVLFLARATTKLVLF